MLWDLRLGSMIVACSLERQIYQQPYASFVAGVGRITVKYCYCITLTHMLVEPFPVLLDQLVFNKSFISREILFYALL